MRKEGFNVGGKSGPSNGKNSPAPPAFWLSLSSRNNKKIKRREKRETEHTLSSFSVLGCWCQQIRNID